MSEEKVIIYGLCANPYTKRIELALKLKSIPYELIQQDFLRYNPVHTIPVLVHNGKPISESLLVVEYIDETWQNSPQLLPNDPYKRAKIRFWATYIQLHIFELLTKLVVSEAEEQKKALAEVKEKLKVIETEGLKEIFSDSDGKPTVTTETMTLVDVVMFTLFSPYKAQEEVLGLKMIDPEIVPGVYAWINAINEVDAVKKLSIPHETVVEILRGFRQMSVSCS